MGHLPHQRLAPYPKGIPPDTIHQVYYYAILPMSVTLSFLGAVTVLRRILKGKPQGIFTKREEVDDYHRYGGLTTCHSSSQQFFDTMVSSIR